MIINLEKEKRFKLIGEALFTYLIFIYDRLFKAIESRLTDTNTLFYLCVISLGNAHYRFLFHHFFFFFGVRNI